MQTRPRSTAIYNKAKLGHDIIQAVADYDPATFEDDATFSAFISDVDAFITTQSILQDALTDELKKRGLGGARDGGPAAPGAVPPMPSMGALPSTGPVPSPSGPVAGNVIVQQQRNKTSGTFRRWTS